jgi:hypothetical protein
VQQQQGVVSYQVAVLRLILQGVCLQAVRVLQQQALLQGLHCFCCGC